MQAPPSRRPLGPPSSAQLSSAASIPFGGAQIASCSRPLDGARFSLASALRIIGRPHTSGWIAPHPAPVPARLPCKCSKLSPAGQVPPWPRAAGRPQSTTLEPAADRGGPSNGFVGRQSISVPVDICGPPLGATSRPARRFFSHQRHQSVMA